MLGAWTMAKPGAQPLVDFTLVNPRVAAAQILTHHPHARVEQVETVAFGDHLRHRVVADGDGLGCVVPHAGPRRARFQLEREGARGRIATALMLHHQNRRGQALRAMSPTTPTVVRSRSCAWLLLILSAHLMSAGGNRLPAT